jgi:hypothetical protein
MAEHIVTAILVLILVPLSLVAGTALFELTRILVDKQRRLALRRETRRAGNWSTLVAILNDHDSPFTGRASLRYRNTPMEKEEKKEKRGKKEKREKGEKLVGVQ